MVSASGTLRSRAGSPASEASSARHRGQASRCRSTLARSAGSIAASTYAPSSRLASAHLSPIPTCRRPPLLQQSRSPRLAEAIRHTPSVGVAPVTARAVQALPYLCNAGRRLPGSPTRHASAGNGSRQARLAAADPDRLFDPGGRSVKAHAARLSHQARAAASGWMLLNRWRCRHVITAGCGSECAR